MLDRVTPRTALKDELVTIVRLLTGLDAPVKGDLPAPEITSSAANEIESTEGAKA